MMDGLVSCVAAIFLAMIWPDFDDAGDITRPRSQTTLNDSIKACCVSAVDQALTVLVRWTRRAVSRNMRKLLLVQVQS